MCGGYARICVRCGLCGKVDARPLNALGNCVRCGHENGPGADVCAQCGARLPKAPGDDMSASASPDISEKA